MWALVLVFFLNGNDGDRSVLGNAEPSFVFLLFPCQREHVPLVTDSTHCVPSYRPWTLSLVFSVVTRVSLPVKRLKIPTQSSMILTLTPSQWVSW